MSRLRHAIEEVRLLGVSGTIFRLLFEMGKRLPFSLRKTIAFPKELSGIAVDKARSLFPSGDVARHHLKNLLSRDQQRDTVHRAQRHVKGEILCFSRWFADFGDPPDWHRNPVRKVSWPADARLHDISRREQEFGDVKLTWELNRFPHFYTLARAWLLTGDDTFVRSFAGQLKEWDKANPAGRGVNWVSGQELALRMMAWIYAYAVMSHSAAWTEEDTQRLYRLIYVHAAYIEKNINYARYAVKNNHLVGEALALYMTGSLFSFGKQAERWREKGAGLLGGKECLGQFYSDGGYCQLSFNYHRLALHYYLWALTLSRLNDDGLGKKFLPVFYASMDFLYHHMNGIDGALPNWGANDGALANPWTSCDYKDFRPLLNALSYAGDGTRLIPPGAWDEELFWFFGENAMSAPVRPRVPESRSFPVTGTHIIRKGKGDFCMLRCGTVHDRYGQADQLHVDLWWRGVNIAIDGGSYLYNDDTLYHRCFMGTGSHNTVTVDGQDQMYLHRRFKWLYWTRAKLIGCSGREMSGEHYGYLGLAGGITHRRNIEVLEGNAWRVIDTIKQKTKAFHRVRLHWLIGDTVQNVSREGENCWKIMSGGHCRMTMRCDRPGRVSIIRAGEYEGKPEGWHSRYYGEKLPASGIIIECETDDGCCFSTVFNPDVSSVTLEAV